MKAVFFDLDNTLYSYDRAHGQAYAAVQALAGRELGLSPAAFDRLHREANAILTRRCGGGPPIHDRMLRFQILLERLGKPIGLAPVLADCYWRTLLDAMEAEPGAVQTLRALKDRGLTLGIGTNMTLDWQLEKLRRLGLLELVDFVVTSEEVGVEKPDPKLFALCAEKADAPAEACCFVGDSLEKDALAARNCGMLGVWYCPGGSDRSLEEVPILRALPELPALLAGLSKTC